MLSAVHGITAPSSEMIHSAIRPYYEISLSAVRGIVTSSGIDASSLEMLISHYPVMEY